MHKKTEAKLSTINILQKHVYSKMLKILQPKKENFQIKTSAQKN